MDNSDQIVQYNDGRCIFVYDKTKCTLSVVGEPYMARNSILKLQREEWLPQRIRAIWFNNNQGVVQLVVGVSLTVYLASTPPLAKPKPRGFKDIVRS